MRSSNRGDRWAWALALVGALAAASTAAADTAALSPDAPVQLSLSEDVQLLGQDRSVRGARLALQSGLNTDVTGFDYALMVARTSRDQLGLQVAGVGEIEGDLLGAQIGIVSADTDGESSGVQFATLIARAGAISGAQLAGLYSRALQVTGVQFALFNYAGELEGVQIGLLNIHRDGWVPIFPGINIGF